MHKAFSKSLARSTLIALAISSLPAFAGYNDDPDCVAVSNGARSGVQRATDAIDQAAANTGAAIDQAKSCVDQLVAYGSRNISDFGGGIQIPDSIRRALAQQGCRVLSAAQTRVTQEVNNQVGRAISQAPVDVQPVIRAEVPNVAPQTTATPSVFQRLVNIF